MRRGVFSIRMNAKKKTPSTLGQRLANPRHPLWGVVKVVLAVVVLAVILFFSVNRFDNSEIEVISWFAAILAVIQTTHEVAKKNQRVSHDRPRRGLQPQGHC